ncbi:polysaccharide pyruvyl transferase family protein [Streptococcus suis]|uniref:polysaccharide pyruvyl transferase family protein n=1 Tax=Streptococcus parasuis TaxID=1501662 RepID=UPI001557AC04|nr:polysaccharide pyruvyl transferase family protein [Streptococcus suis]WNF87123.1 polysaccharide pyruvyl transferase family protein [Streptococcus parasuis]
MKKVFLKCVFEQNLGDDLLINILCSKYSSSQFYIISDKDIDSFPNNLKIIKVPSLLYRLFRKTAFKLKKMNFIDSIIISQLDYVVVIGGSMFMETKSMSDNYDLIWYKKLVKPLYIIGSNIGPIHTNDYLKRLKEEVFSSAVDISLRDQKSYNMISDLSAARYTSDLVFTYDVSPYKTIKSSKKVIISVIDCEKKSSQMKNVNSQLYEEKIKELISYFYTQGFEVELFSFCKKEGDERIIDKIINELPYYEIKKYFYTGDIDSALRELATSSIIVGSRFHANILGMILKKSVIPIIYNDKTRNMLNDINFKGKVIDLENIVDFNVDDLDESDLEYKCNVELYQKTAQLHFQELAKILE